MLSFWKKLRWLLPLLALGPGLALAQNCPDPQATNYNPGATTNDGSCQYAATATPLPPRAQLNMELSESSGLQLLGGQLWSHNDSGNDPVLFRLDTTSGQTLQRVRLSNAANTDWEDLAADANYLYVGDFGNNFGNRRDLRVLRVARADLGATATTATAEAINFSYPDQTDFTSRLNQHNFDCEAFFFAHDSLHLFTKDWVDFKTRYYTVPAAPGTYVAHLKATFDVNGLITAADINPAGTVASLLGYDTRSGAAFVWLLSGFGGTRYLGANKRRIELPSVIAVGQVEGLAFGPRNRVFISNERVSNALLTVPAQLYALGVGRWLPGATALATIPAASADVGIVATPNPARQRLHLARANGATGAATIRVLSLQGQEVLTETLAAGTQQQDVDLAGLEPGVYVLRLELGGRAHTQKLVVP
ncbi:T9SS type A sorting domain-containing protein [Hymenobacter sp. RP-2-7]|uniref:T9SS type A sorting domain-containing protein n=1 Tax=Hymenobacter polaris TaxID=2682546 RepID=A0A7Y0AFV0_9BACT|nr:T9SS type A sorting domain-containing protein [Hymenobacter polaris]NML66595.1 T9SS type A sorting domain-containing protein [Hymenobacter polaris]